MTQPTLKDFIDDQGVENLKKLFGDLIREIQEKPVKSIKKDDRIMSPKQFVERLLNSNLYDLLSLLVWYCKRDGITCIDCIQTRKLMSGKPPNCVACGLPTARLLKKYFNINPYKEKSNEKIHKIK